jgi:hypothetical protein
MSIADSDPASSNTSIHENSQREEGEIIEDSQTNESKLISEGGAEAQQQGNENQTENRKGGGRQGHRVSLLI